MVEREASGGGESAARGESVAAPRRPVGLFAALAALAISVGAAWQQEGLAHHLAGHRLRAMAQPLERLKLQTLTFQRTAFESDRMLPVYGSSELFCCGASYRPSRIFASEPTGFNAFSIGMPGAGDLLFALSLGALGKAIEGKKVVVIDSPPWFFNRNGINPGWYIGLFSSEIAYMFIFEAPISLELREIAARRMLDYPKTLEPHPLLRAAVRELADPTPLHLATYHALRPLGRLAAWIERVNDASQTRRFVHRHKSWKPVPYPYRRTLDWVGVTTEATQLAERNDTTNPFGFPDDSFQQMVKKEQGRVQQAIAVYRSGGTNRDGRLLPEPPDWTAEMQASVEWTDLRLVIGILRELGAHPLIVGLPMPGPYDDYTELSPRLRRVFYDRWDAAVRGTGIPWVDLRDADEDPFFLTDSGAHLSPRGWVFADRMLDMFWHGSTIDEMRAELTTLAEQVPAPAVRVTRVVAP